MIIPTLARHLIEYQVSHMNQRKNNKSGHPTGAKYKSRVHHPSDSVYKDKKQPKNIRSGNISQNTRSSPHGKRPDQGDVTIYLYGLHTVRAAFENPCRKIVRLVSSHNAWDRLDIGQMDQMPFPVELATGRDLDRLVGKDAIHQGVIAEVLPLESKSLDQLDNTRLIVVLDEVTDPHNVGAIMRSCVALGAEALVTTIRNAPKESGVLAKSASGALEMIEYIQVKNLGRAIEELHFIGFQTIGLDSQGPKPLEETFSRDRIALVLGAEGKGLRHKTAAYVSDLARLDMPGAIKSLNVSNAATLSLYAANRYFQSAHRNG